jgi:hypothetical protein
MTRLQKYGKWTKCIRTQNSPFNHTLCQNVMSFDKTFDSIMKSMYSLIINDPQTDENKLHLAIS